MNEVAVCVANLSKRYRIGARRNAYRTLRESLTESLTAPLRWVKHMPPESARMNAGSIWALKDLSFQVRPGEVLGIIGPNGAGKSTLLKILSRITRPTEGYADIHGRLSALLEVGTGIHPELTGRENIFLSGAILGMRRSEIIRKFDEIVAFSEVNRFIDTPVKHYSTGMMVRLAFGVAAHLEPEVLLVDEVLAVGDLAFQKKCLGKMEEVTQGGRTVLFVSHNMGAVRQLCNRVIWLEEGMLMGEGETGKLVADYQAHSSKGFIQKNLESDCLRIEAVILRGREGRSRSIFRPGEDLSIEIHFTAKELIPRPYFWVNVISQYGSLFGANMLLDGHQPDSILGRGMLTCTLRNIPLLPQMYSIRMGARAGNGVTFLVKTAEVAFFTVEGDAQALGWGEARADSLMSSSAPVFIPYEWKLPDGQIHPVLPRWDRDYEKMLPHSKG